MKRVIKAVTLSVVAIVFFGCAQNYYNVPRETYEKKVRTLGVAPLFVDGESDIKHPEKEALVSLIKDANRKNEKELVAQLRDTGSYFSVRLLDDDADSLYSTLFSRRERRDDARVIYNKHFFKAEEIRNIITKNNLDALMLVTVSGLTMKDKVYSNTYLSYLESDYNYLTMTAQILDADGNILWEYPNFRQRAPTFPMMFPLQYTAFDEAAANLNDHVDVRFKTSSGIGRAFAKTQKSAVQVNAKVSPIYSHIFEDMVSLLKPEMKWFGGDKKEAPKVETK